MEKIRGNCHTESYFEEYEEEDDDLSFFEGMACVFLYALFSTYCFIKKIFFIK